MGQDFNGATIFTDASYHEGRAGAGFWMRCNQMIETGSEGFACANCGEAETYACLLGLRRALLAYPDCRSYVLQSDSLHALGVVSKNLPQARVTKHSASKVNQIKGSAREQEWIKQHLAATQGFTGTIWLKHVKGHSKEQDPRSHVNRVVDGLAGKARKAFRV